MAAESRRDSASVAERLYEKPRAFDFLQAVRILRALDPSGRTKLPADDPSDEFVRFGSSISLAFPTSDVTEIRPADEGHPVPALDVSFMGLGSAHAMGSLPTAYISLMLDEPRREDSALHDFFNIFDHRLISLYFGTSTKHDPILQLESGDSVFERVLSSLCGVGTEGLRDRVSFDDRALLGRTALIAMSPIPAVAIQGILESFFEVPFELEQFLPTWFEVQAEDRTRLGRDNTILGEEVYLGESIELCQSRFRLRVGPLSWDEYRNFFADGPSFRALVDLLAVAAPSDQDFEIQLTLAGDEVPALQLTRQPQDGARLGWSTWLNPTEAPATSATPPGPASTESDASAEPDFEPEQREDRQDAILTRLSLNQIVPLAPRSIPQQETLP